MQLFNLPKKIAHYTLTRFIARGGMGEVYLAIDDNLQRHVAVKFLNIQKQDQERRQRFMTEARAIASVNHPNIVTIHDVGEVVELIDAAQWSIPYIAMEYVEGESLDNLLKTSLSFQDTTKIAIQIAEGLIAAHKRRLVHRDIKPSNIMITYDGRVKLLDFGLTKFIRDNSAEASTQIQKTEEGAILGTIDYMSPEQALGRKVDDRSDIFSFGIVLYQLLSGQHPFYGENSVEVIAKIVTQTPFPWPDNCEAPASLKEIVDKCLKKDPEERFQTSQQLLEALQMADEQFGDQKMNSSLSKTLALKYESKTRTDEQTSNTLEHRLNTVEQRNATIIDEKNATTNNEKMLASAVSGKMLTNIFIGILVVSLLSAFYFWFKQKSATVSSKQLHGIQFTTKSGLDFYPAFSPDGKWLAYSSDHTGSFEIYVRQLTSGGREIPITADGGQNFQPAWSPDGERIAFHSKNRGGIWVVPAFGGLAKQITNFGSKPAWSPNRSAIAFQSDPLIDLAANSFAALPPSSIWIVVPETGELTQLTKPGRPEGGHGAPAWSPDGKRIAFSTYDRIKSTIWSVSSTGVDLVKVVDQEKHSYDPIYSPDGKSLYYCNISKNWSYGMWQVGLRNGTGEVVGEPTELTNLGLGPVKHLAVSPDGKRLAYSSLSITSNLFEISLDSSGQAEGKPKPLTKDTGRNTRPAFSPDGSKIAFTKWRSGVNEDIWMMNVDGSGEVQLTNHSDSDSTPSWFPDGSKIAFSSKRGGHVALWSVDLKSGREEKIFDIGDDIDYARLSPNGQEVIFNLRRGSTLNLWKGTLSNGQTEQLTFDAELMGFGCWSNDGKQIALEIKRGENMNLAVIPNSGGEPRRLTIGKGQDWPYSWSPDNDKVAFAGLRDGVWNIFWASTSKGDRKQLTTNDKLNIYVRYPAWSPDGKKIIHEQVETTGNIWLIENLK